MYDFIEVIKFNDKYFENGDIVAITKNDDSVIVGGIMIGNYNGSVTDDNCIALDVSEKYHQKRAFIYPREIKNIQKVD